MAGVLIRRQPSERIDTGRTLCEDGGRDWIDASTSQGPSRMARYHQKLGKRHKTDSLSEYSEGTHPADNLIWATQFT